MKPKQLLSNFQTEEPKDETMQKAEKATETLSFGAGRFAKKGNDGKFYAYGGNAPDVELDPAELAKTQEAKAKPAEPDRIEQLKAEHIAESKKVQGREAPFRAAPKMKQGSPREVIDSLGREEAAQEKTPKYSNVDPDVLKKMRREEMKYLDPRSARELAVMSDDDFIDYLKYTFDHTAPGGFDKMAEHQKLFLKPQEAPQEFTDDRLAEEIMDNEYIYNGISRERAAEIMSKRLGVSYDRAKKFLDDTDFDPNYGEEEYEKEQTQQPQEAPQQRAVTKEDLENMADFADGYLGYDGWTIAKTPTGFFTNVTLGDPDEEPIEIDNETALKYFKELFKDAGLRKDYEDQFGKLPFAYTDKVEEEAPQPQEPDDLQALREKHKKSIIKPSEVAPFWAYVDPTTKYASRFKTEEDALRYAEQAEESHRKFAAQQAEMLINDFKEGKVGRKELSQFGKNQFAPEILSYLLSKIK